MPFQLDTPIVNPSIANIEIVGFGINEDKGFLRIAYYEVDAAENRLHEDAKAYTLWDRQDTDEVGNTVVITEVTEAITRASIIAAGNPDVRAAIKQALYEALTTKLGLTGTIV